MISDYRQAMKHVVHCSGYSLAEKFGAATNKFGSVIAGKFHDWDHVCIGRPKGGVLGRIPMALHIAALLSAESIVWSTGATYSDGHSEAEIMQQEAVENFGYILSRDDARRISIIEKESSNTLTSMQELLTIIKTRFSAANVMLHLVTSANHAPRVARDAVIVFKHSNNVVLSVVPAHTSYGDKGPENVVIHEFTRGSAL